MRRQDIQLLAAARSGDGAARCEVGRRYLLGVDGFPKHLATGLQHLGDPGVRELPQVASIIAASLTLDELLQSGQAEMLERAARAGSSVALLKLGAWLLTQPRRFDEARQRLQAAAERGDPHAAAALDAVANGTGDADRAARLMRSLSATGAVDAAAVTQFAAHQALDEGDLSRLIHCLGMALECTPAPTPELAALIVASVSVAEHAGRADVGLPVHSVESSLELCSGAADLRATYALGRALSGLTVGSIQPHRLVGAVNLRKGTALLLRAADQGQAEAWLHLYHLSSDNRCSVANPQMARFFLEKAASHSLVEAQRKLGALMLRESSSLAHSELAIHWLYAAARQGDAYARQLLASLVLPVAGSDAQAQLVIDDVQRTDPWLASRLRLARRFGLSKLEALSVDPVAGRRPWGLVVGRNPFIAQTRLSAPRAIPATTTEALDDLTNAATLFERTRRQPGAVEGDLRRRARSQRVLFERHAVDESLFFAKASAATLDALRVGPKWAFRSRQVLQLALGA